MIQVLIFTPYIILPLLITLLFRQFGLSKEWRTYLITASIIIFFPIVLYWMFNYLNPPPPSPPQPDVPDCGTSSIFIVYLANLIICLPISLLLQLYFNNKLVKGKSKTIETDTSYNDSHLNSEDYDKY
jgi:hypothetical protein